MWWQKHAYKLVSRSSVLCFFSARYFSSILLRVGESTHNQQSESNQTVTVVAIANSGCACYGCASLESSWGFFRCFINHPKNSFTSDPVSWPLGSSHDFPEHWQVFEHWRDFEESNYSPATPQVRQEWWQQSAASSRFKPSWEPRRVQKIREGRATTHVERNAADCRGWVIL